MASLRFHPAADEELIEAAEWYLARSATAATRFHEEVEEALTRIAATPERYPLTRFGRRRFMLLGYPYDLVYRIHQGEPRVIEIIAFSHHARRPGYWRER